MLSAVPPAAPEDDPADLTRGWQRPASRTVDEFCHRAIRRELDAPGLSGSHAASVLTTRPASPELSLSSPFFRVLLLRRLRLPLPLTAARCRCRQPQDLFGDHLAACPRSGALRAKGGPLERTAARICREAGATVAFNVRLRDLNVDAARQDERRIEAIANGFALRGGGARNLQLTPLPPPQVRRSHCRRCTRTRAQSQGAHLPRAPTVRDASLSSLSSSVAAGALNLPPLSDFSCASAGPCSPLRLPVPLLQVSSPCPYLPLGGTVNVDGEPPLQSDILAQSFLEPPLASRMP